MSAGRRALEHDRLFACHLQLEFGKHPARRPEPAGFLYPL